MPPPDEEEAKEADEEEEEVLGQASSTAINDAGIALAVFAVFAVFDAPI